MTFDQYIDMPFHLPNEPETTRRKFIDGILASMHPSERASMWGMIRGSYHMGYDMGGWETYREFKPKING